MLIQPRMTVRAISASAVVIAAMAVCSCIAYADESPAVEKYLTEGRLAEGSTAMQKILAAQPQDQEARPSSMQGGED